MWRARRRIALRVLLALCAIGPAAAITPEQQQAIRAATFEVVIPKPKADPLSYEKPLPLELLPYRERTDAYNSIGTAFALGDNHYVTAGHVLQAAIASQGGAPALRGSDGAVHAIDRILKYSAFEDFVLFSLVDDPKPKGFAVNREPALDDPVLAVGNALGEGVVIRDGLYTSATPEDQDGRWKWIRFSAAASPGNSGGPLLDREGQVIGIVLRKSENENLNYALPISRVLDAPDARARYDERVLVTLPWLQGGRTYSYKDEFALPLAWPAFERAHEAVALKHTLAGREALLAERADTLFPKGKGTESLLFDADANDYQPWFVGQQNDGSWGAMQPYFEHVDLPGDGAVHSTRMVNGSLLLRVVRSDQASDDAFVHDSAAFMDIALKALNVRRPVGSDQVRVTSAGKAARESLHVDRYGRRWQVRSWPLSFFDAWLVTYMLPTPDGYAGLVQVAPSSVFDEVMDLGLRTTDLMQVSYRGTLLQWQRFLSRREFLPDALRAYHLDERPVWHLSGPRFTLQVPTDLFTSAPDNVLALTMGFQPGMPLRCDVDDVWWFRDHQWRFALGLRRRVEPPATARLELRNGWRDMQERTGAYAGRLSREQGDAFALSMVVDVPGKDAGKVAADVLYALTAQVDGTRARDNPDALEQSTRAALAVNERATGVQVAASARPDGAAARRAEFVSAFQSAAPQFPGASALQGLTDPAGATFAGDLAVFAQSMAMRPGIVPDSATLSAPFGQLTGYWGAIRRLKVGHEHWQAFLARHHLPPGTSPGAHALELEHQLAGITTRPPDEEAARIAHEAAAAWNTAGVAPPPELHVEVPEMIPRKSPCPAPTAVPEAVPAPVPTGEPGQAPAAAGRDAPARISGSPQFGEDYYPTQVKRESFEGSVVVRAHIDEQGCADALGIANSSGSAELDDAALAGAEKMTFLPAEHDGKPVASVKSLKIAFKLRE
jgi:TonB family protein